MRDVVINICTKQLEQLPQNSDACYAVDIVVAVDGDFFGLFYGLCDTPDGFLDTGHKLGANKVGEFRL